MLPGDFPLTEPIEKHGPRGNQLLASLPDSVIVKLEPVVVVSFASGSVVQNEGDKVRHIYFPTTGMVSLLTIMKDGRSVDTVTVGREGEEDDQLRAAAESGESIAVISKRLCRSEGALRHRARALEIVLRRVENRE